MGNHTNIQWSLVSFFRKKGPETFGRFSKGADRRTDFFAGQQTLRCMASPLSSSVAGSDYQ